MGASLGQTIQGCCSRHLPAGEAQEEFRPGLREEFRQGRSVSHLDPAEVARNANADEVLALKARLEEAGIATSRFGKGSAKPLELLYREVDEGQSLLEPIPGDPKVALRRIVEQVSMIVVATLDGIERVLVSLTQVLHDHRVHMRKQFLVHKLTVGQDWRDGLETCIAKRLQLSVKDQKQHLFVDDDSYTFREEDFMSRGYPGLPTHYRMHEVVVFVENPLDPALECLGLPDARGFSSMEGAIGTDDVKARLNVWSWEEAPALVNQGLLSTGRYDNVRGRPLVVKALSTLKRGTVISLQDMVLRVKQPEPLSPRCLPPDQQGKSPNDLLASLVSGEKMDHEAAERAARCIRDRDYSLRSFFDDCSKAFPELRLYLASQPASARSSEHLATSSGRSTDDEYQRTIGALFAVYWLMRVDIDGKDGFCFGVSPDWQVQVPSKPPAAVPKAFGSMTKEEKRQHFHAAGPWQTFTELLLDAGLWCRDANGRVTAPVERTKAMLALTAVHDIMKIEALLPRVAPEHAPFGTYGQKEEIGDHDLALAYVLEHFRECVPSVHGLPPESRRTVLFTQSKMEFNNGWMVQAEAPPGKLLRSFKSVLQRGPAGSRGGLRPQDPSAAVSQQDVAFYFVHWITDLAGAVPTPLTGSEKFVVQFPHALLEAFLNSFKILKHLADMNETMVFEHYLRMRWQDAQPSLPPLTDARGPEEICRCRLLCMAQVAAPKILEAFERLSPGDRAFLSQEMSLTGAKQQVYSLCRGAEGTFAVGPAFLVYYGPALLQKSGLTEPDLALQMLIGIFRAGREMWPSNADQADETVTLRIDTLKELTVEELRTSMQQTDVWVLVWHSASEAFVERHPLHVLNALNRDRKVYQVLCLLRPHQLANRRTS